jgi:hypothetical protein
MKKGKKAGPGVIRQADESAIIEYIKGKRQPQMPKNAAAAAGQ